MMVHYPCAIKQVALLGAYDRFNYGDLLFPIVVKNEIESHSPNIDVLVHALAKSNLSEFGALETQSMRALYRKGNLREGDTVIFAGGGTIGVDWTYMHANLLGRAGNWILYYLKRTIGEPVADKMSRFYFGARAPFPWVAGPEDFPVPVNVAYNAVGGSEFSKLSPTQQSLTLDRLRRAAYISVRDVESKRLFASIESSVSVELVPDSAVLMSEQFSIDWLDKQAGQQLKELLGKSPYMCFQSNIVYESNNEERIVAEIEAVYERHGLRAILLPIGRYVGLDDSLALRKVLHRIRTPADLESDKATIWEIMLTIARARLFIGTSLHGNITAQSYAVPHIGIGDRRCKVDYYLETWDIPEQSRCARLEDLSDLIDIVLAVPGNQRQEKRKELIAKSRGNFRKMAKACSIGWS